MSEKDIQDSFPYGNSDSNGGREGKGLLMDVKLVNYDIKRLYSKVKLIKCNAVREKN